MELLNMTIITVRNNVFTFNFIVSIFISLLVANSVCADTAYSWRDAQGRTVFGNRPPTTKTTEAKKVSATLSRYSSDKMFSHYGAKARASLNGNSTATPKEFNLLDGADLLNGGNLASVVNSQNQLGQDSKPTPENLLEQESAKPSIEPEPITEDAKSNIVSNVPLPETTIKKETSITDVSLDGLVSDNLSVSHDSIGRIISCSVRVKNTHDKEKNNIMVMFEFDDGTVIQAKGVSNISPNSSEIFAMPRELFPFDIRPVVNHGVSSKSEKFNVSEWRPIPKVVIKIKS